MSELTAASLWEILHSAAGDSGRPGAENILDETFEDLGYDSLALLEAAGLIQRRYGVQLADDSVTQVATPRELLQLANDAVAEAI